MGFRGAGGRGGGFNNRGGGRGDGNRFKNQSFGKRGRGGGGKFGGREKFHDDGPPEQVIEFGQFTHPCQNQLIVKSNIEQVPFFNAPIYLEDKQKIGKVDEIFGSIRDYYISVEPIENIFANSFKPSTKLYVDPAKLLPLSRFLGTGTKKPMPKQGGNRGGFRGDRRGGSAGDRGGRGRHDKFGGSRGGFNNNNSNSRGAGSFGFNRRGGSGSGFRGSFRGRPK
ncbi:hypothetical protein QR98_0086870 [Sarcoptes scabiei]|uniref:H/ACA ribonucleoprotein complex subunit n=1 Tax=Sarcoptes scabiei TaxID=52283 RepID=A0A132AGT6_SARSC|nr:hypothetical protein QR98_0086870 [Sarcoptes scabiei]